VWLSFHRSTRATRKSKAALAFIRACPFDSAFDSGDLAFAANGTDPEVWRSGLPLPIWASKNPASD
jgi:hypothetical protein